jgi:hypothetical protein
VSGVRNGRKLGVFNMSGKRTHISRGGVFVEGTIDEQHGNLDRLKHIYILALIDRENPVNVKHDLLLVTLDHAQQILVIVTFQQTWKISSDGVVQELGRPMDISSL